MGVSARSFDRKGRPRSTSPSTLSIPQIEKQKISQEKYEADVRSYETFVNVQKLKNRYDLTPEEREYLEIAGPYVAAAESGYYSDITFGEIPKFGGQLGQAVKTAVASEQEAKSLQQQASQKLGVSLTTEQVKANKQLVQQALKQESSQYFGFQPEKDTDLSFQGLADANNRLVEQQNKLIEEITKESNPLVASLRVKKELEPLQQNIKSIQSDYLKLAQVVETHQPKLVDVSGYSRRGNPLKQIKEIRANIGRTRAEIAMEKDPYKQQAIKLIDQPNLENLEKQLVFEEKAVKQGMAQSFIARGATGQVPQMIGAPVPLFATPSIRMPKQKSNMLAGLPDLGDIGKQSMTDMKRIERRMMRQPKRSRRSYDKYLDFKGYNIFG